MKVFDVISCRRATVLGTLVVIFIFSLPVGSQIAIVPGSAVRGQEIFSDKGCIGCHAMNGQGGTVAPDLARRSVRLYTPDLLAAVMWNHAPEMWKAITESGDAIPSLTSNESADLFSYFYSRLYFSLPGDAGRGRAVFVNRSCGNCHDIESSTDGNKVGPPVSTWNRVGDPITWAERMWNHSERMYEQMQRESIPWPKLSTPEMVDLLVYLRNLPSTRSQQASFQPGEPELGRAVFESNCEKCHSFGGALRNRVDLLERQGPRTLTGYATYMWNHAPQMAERASEGLPSLNDGSMTHLVAYLFTQRYFFEKGDVEKGHRIYQSKNCVVCHEEDRVRSGAPDLTQGSETYSPITMTRSLWTHGPAMLRAIEERNIAWPIFERNEMTDLIAYLNSRLTPKVADVRRAND